MGTAAPPILPTRAAIRLCCPRVTRGRADRRECGVCVKLKAQAQGSSGHSFSQPTSHKHNAQRSTVKLIFQAHILSSKPSAGARACARPKSERDKLTSCDGILGRTSEETDHRTANREIWPMPACRLPRTDSQVYSYLEFGAWGGLVTYIYITDCAFPNSVPHSYGAIA